MNDQNKVRACRICGCTQLTPCMIRVKRPFGETQFQPCSWFEKDLCSDPRCVMLGTHVQVSQDEMQAIAMLLSNKPLPRELKMMMRGIRRRELRMNRRSA